MLVFDDPERMRQWSWDRRRDGRRIAVVPTMGALHTGHLSLVERAMEVADLVVVTIFVNPLQFDRAADLDAYPRPIDDDVEACEHAGVHAVYAPTSATMYPSGFDTRVEPGALAELLEGARRPGHFGGVTTVVTKLLAATAPDVAVFGQKDFQQLAVIRRLVTDLDLGVDVIGVPTVREADGLAMSSRNVHLGPEDRTAATVIRRAALAVRDAFEAGDRDASALCHRAATIIADERRARIDYVELVDQVELRALTMIDRPAVLLVAAWFGDVRLIDNELLETL